MDPYTVGGMIFSVVMVLIIGGFIVTFPIIRSTWSRPNRLSVTGLR